MWQLKTAPKGYLINTRDSPQGRNLFTLQCKVVTIENENKMQEHKGPTRPVAYNE